MNVETSPYHPDNIDFLYRYSRWVRRFVRYTGDFPSDRCWIEADHGLQMDGVRVFGEELINRWIEERRGFTYCGNWRTAAVIGLTDMSLGESEEEFTAEYPLIVEV